MTDTRPHAGAQPLRHDPGTFCWMDLATTDLPGALAFYSAMFGWTTTDMGGPDLPYMMIHHGGRDIGGIYILPEQQRERGIPPHWLPYIAVEDAGATAALVREHAGRVVSEPCAVGDAGTTAVALDPQGAMFALWQPRGHPGAGTLHAPGAMTWNELGTSDLGSALTFYGAVFGWSSRLMDQASDPPYHLLLQGQRTVGGAYPLEGPVAGAPPHWMTYFAVPDCDAAAARAGELRAEVHVPPTDIPDTGRFAMIKDPQGAYFCVIRLG